MSSYVQALEKKGLIKPPQWLSSNIQYECIMGSVAYGVSNDQSDCDVYGFAIPQKEVAFPHLKEGFISGFGEKPQAFDQYQQQHVKDVSAEKEYDFTIYNIVRYFQLCMDANPNLLDSLFVPLDCVIHSTQVGNMVRDARHLFLHKGCFHRMKSYAYSQFHKASTKKPIGKRKEEYEKTGTDFKFLYHCVRLVGEVEQILAEQDLDLRRNKEQLKAIRAGEMSQEEVRAWFSVKEVELEKLYHASTLPWGPDEDKIKTLLLSCLEHHYGNLEKAYTPAAKQKRFCIKNIKPISPANENEECLFGSELDEFFEEIGRENVINVQSGHKSLMIYYWS